MYRAITGQLMAELLADGSRSAFVTFCLSRSRRTKEPTAARKHRPANAWISCVTRAEAFAD
jgi:hypothetical protein